MRDYFVTIKNSFMDVERVYISTADNQDEAEINAREDLREDEYLYEVTDLGDSDGV